MFVEYVVVVVVAVPGLLLRWVLHGDPVSWSELRAHEAGLNATYTALLLVAGGLAQQLWAFVWGQ
ncbi:hypothetical protein [Hymenobacter arizonensis]|uniref:hypothetical protein n=1 Tax=Hymenobacter arizonensis TaxID=1227077 RepID=UPI001160B446|nr:hypothetical protein [Hymenobacter arizonensis]